MIILLALRTPPTVYTVCCSATALQILPAVVHGFELIVWCHWAAIRLLRSAAMPKAQTPHMPGDIEYEAQKAKQKSVLLSFLKAAVPTRLQVSGNAIFS